MGFWIPAFAGMTVMQRSPFARTTDGGGRPRGTPLPGRDGLGDVEREGDEIPRLRFASLGMTRGREEERWVPACARTRGGGGRPRGTPLPGRDGLGDGGGRMREDNGGGRAPTRDAPTIEREGDEIPRLRFASFGMTRGEGRKDGSPHARGQQRGEGAHEGRPYREGTVWGT